MHSRPLKKFTSMSDVSLEYLSEVLELWGANKMNESEILLFAEQLHDLGPGFPSYSITDTRSVVVNVLDALVMMYSNPTVKEDIPALQHCIDIARTSPEEALRFLDSYWQSIDWDSRIEQQIQQIKGDKHV